MNVFQDPAEIRVVMSWYEADGLVEILWDAAKKHPGAQKIADEIYKALNDSQGRPPAGDEGEVG